MAIDDNTSYELTGYQVKDLAQKIRAKADSASLASVATSGLYSDLTGAPTIPTVYNGTLTITQGGATLGTFTANQSTASTIDIPAGGTSAITYYIADGEPAASLQLEGSKRVYEDSARTIEADAGTVYSNIQAGNTVVLEYRTGMNSATPRVTQFTVTSMTRRTTGSSGDLYDYTGTLTSYGDGTNSTSPSVLGFEILGAEPTTWAFQRVSIPAVYDGTLTIQQNGTTVDTFTANSATNKTVNIETITAETVAPAQQVGAITASMIDWSTIVTVLYDGGTTGTTGSVTLSESAANFSRLKIFYRNNDLYYNSVEVWSPNGKMATLICDSAPTGNAWYGKVGTYSISGTTLTKNRSLQISAGSSAGTVDNAYIVVTRVEGWKI